MEGQKTVLTCLRYIFSADAVHELHAHYEIYEYMLDYLSGVAGEDSGRHGEVKAEYRWRVLVWIQKLGHSPPCPAQQLENFKILLSFNSSSVPSAGIKAARG